ncbi:hypothetical protein [Salmonirosea aquatica]|uniref:Glycosyltransferase RgtA/B/C/D-like domain-containing protein n=1 Tax=Salmonirosea aquatica TaxID=2654236 RepID=A0A7C9FZ11_9BACT|nr:hypothetical protein [Cytophagaceae bacterium SJW1-29]
MKQQVSLSEHYARLNELIERYLSGKYWLWKLTLCCAVISWCLAVPPYTVMNTSDAWAFIQIQSQDILHPTHLEVYIRRENMVMRWVLPLMYILTGHSVLLIVIIQGLLGCGFLYLFLGQIFRQTNDRILTAFFGLALSNMFVFSWFFVDTAGYGDGYAYFFLMLALLTRNPFLLFVLLQIAFFTDERALVGAGYIILWWTTDHLVNQKEGGTLAALFRSAFQSRTWVVIAAWGVYFVFRSYIMRTYFPNHDYSTMGTPVLFADGHRWGLGNSLWTSFEGAWLLLGAAGYVLYQTGRRWLLLALLAGFVLLIITGIFVHDIDRDLAYGFSFLLSASLILSRLIPAPEYRKLVFIMAVVCMISPMCYTMGYNRVLWVEPLPMKALMVLDRSAGWGWFD